ncbi:hypothetical protein H6P81_004290 [Aristolochia fimbriata]|uniref:Uncharacterized protein n=1 Tax=Aristolochia fimbriata TaxID=158543 RepID=A0AAV7FHX7_ARIFI|nr:hypothetical protein H6P81_004290 [Aristolochia fimbriata]
MAKIHPQASSSSSSAAAAAAAAAAATSTTAAAAAAAAATSTTAVNIPSSSPSLSSCRNILERKTYTVWMKSLILNGNGCVIFDSNGQIVYRVDNYNRRCNEKVYLMDPRGHILFTILRKKLRVFGRWEGYKGASSAVSKVDDHDQGKPWFRVIRACCMFRGVSPCSVTVGLEKTPTSCYRITGLKSGCSIAKQTGELIAEVKQKRSSSGVALGDDVLSLVVETDIDHSLVMGLVIVYGLMKRNM